MTQWLVEEAANAALDFAEHQGSSSEPAMTAEEKAWADAMAFHGRER